MRTHLKVKVNSLSAEMTIIRRQELKWKKRARDARTKQKSDSVAYAEQAFWSLRGHRTELKAEMRSAHLANCAMKGTPYSVTEPICYGVLKGFGSTEPNWQVIQDTVERFSKDEPNRQGALQKFSEWIADAKIWYEGNEQRLPAFNAPEKAAERRVEAALRKIDRKARRDAEAPQVEQ